MAKHKPVTFYEDWEVIYVKRTLSLCVRQELPHSAGVCVNSLFFTGGRALVQAGTIQQMVLSTKKTKSEKQKKPTQQPPRKP